jgi:UDP-N-acetylglucosamine 4-epimerase
LYNRCIRPIPPADLALTRRRFPQAKIEYRNGLRGLQAALGRAERNFLNRISNRSCGGPVSAITQIAADLRRYPKVWLITGVAGFIGSSLLDALLSLDQRVIGVDNFSSGYRSNLHDVLREHPNKRHLFELVEGDICNFGTCLKVCAGVDYVLHQAAIVSVQRSRLDPIAVSQVNVDGTINVLLAARDARARRVVFASSSAVYGDANSMPLQEDALGTPLSTYGVSKWVNEKYAEVFSQNYRIETVGLRYFNVFGPRQDPHGGYAAVIPRWIHQINSGKACLIHGDGETTRDFVGVRDVVQANILATTIPVPTRHRVFNVGAGRSTSLIALHNILRKACSSLRPSQEVQSPMYGDFREGDVRHSQADITRIKHELKYDPAPDLLDGLEATMRWYFSHFAREALARSA